MVTADIAQQLIALVILWGGGFLSIYALAAQAFTHYRLKTTYGMSSYTIWIFYSSSVLIGLFVATGTDSLPRRFCTPIQVGLLGLFVIQEFIYTDNAEKKQWLTNVYLLSTVIHIGAGALLYYDLTRYHDLIGWIGTWFMSVTSLPQIIKIYRTKTTYGLSTQYLIFNLLRTLFSFWASYLVINESSQVAFTLLRGFCVNVILLVQKVYYGERKPRHLDRSGCGFPPTRE